jgi:hypothetical protein
MLQINDGPPTTHQAQGQALNSGAELLLYDAEVPREGVQVTRARRTSRWINGSTFVWTAFRKQGPGRRIKRPALRSTNRTWAGPVIPHNLIHVFGSQRTGWLSRQSAATSARLRVIPIWAAPPAGIAKMRVRTVVGLTRPAHNWQLWAAQ